jgi:hypothetical protein
MSGQVLEPMETAAQEAFHLFGSQVVALVRKDRVGARLREGSSGLDQRRQPFAPQQR